MVNALAQQARGMDESDPERARLLRTAVDLWRGEPLAGLPGEWAARVREGLRQQLLGVLTDWAAGELRLGRPAAVIDRLSRELDQHPLAEPLIFHLMRALHLQGRRAEALDQYARSRQHLAEELGVEPGAELRELHRAILRDNVEAGPEQDCGPLRRQPAAGPTAQTSAAATPALAAALPRPGDDPPAATCQLPVDLPDHTGHEPERLQAVTALLRPPAVGVSRQAVILSGPGGVGKTSLSIHLAHQLRSSYPDGQLFVGLAGTAGQSGEALGRVLRALGVVNLHQYRTAEERLVRYRAAISGKRILIVLDDATKAEEIRHLVPGAPGAALIVSSRAGLPTVPAAEHIELGLLSRSESLTLLRRVVGDDRVAVEADAAEDLVEICGGLPLALRIVGARLAARPHWRLATLVQRMSDERRRLDEMTADGLAVRVSVAIGYQGLAPAARRLFRLIGFLNAPDLAAWAAAALLHVPVDTAEDLLEQLIDARLINVVKDPAWTFVRYRMHGLVRLYAHERAVAEDGADALRAAVQRVVAVAIELVEQLGERLPYAVPRLYRQPADPVATEISAVDAGADQSGWAAAEGPFLVSLVERAAELGVDQAVCVLADALVFATFALHNDFDGWNRAHAASLRVARETGNLAAQAVIECGIAQLRYKEDRFNEAEEHFPRAIELFVAAGHDHGAAAARSGLGAVLLEVGRHREAVPLLEQALETLDQCGDRDGAAHAAYGLGHSHRELGNDETAVRHLEHAGDLYRSMGHWRGEAIALRGIGLVYRARDKLDAAAHWCGRAHDLVQQHGDPHLFCYTAQAVAKVRIRQGQFGRAQEPLEASLAVCRNLRDRFGVALILRTIGELHLATGRTDSALRELHRAHAAWAELDHALGKARVMRDVGAAHALAGDCAAAHTAWRSAWRTFFQLGTREATELPAWRRRWGCDCDVGFDLPVAVAGPDAETAAHVC